MRALVFGGRDYNEYVSVYDALDDIHKETPISHVIVGGAPGADYWGEAWAHNHAVPFTVFKANWKAYGRAAGPMRNQRMIDDGRPDFGVSFPGGRGTEDMKRRLLSAGIKVIDIPADYRSADRAPLALKHSAS